MTTLNSYPRNCALRALSYITDLPDEKVADAFVSSGSYKPEDGVNIFTLHHALNGLNITYQDHYTTSEPYQKIKKWFDEPDPMKKGLNPQIPVIPIFEKLFELKQGCHIVLVYNSSDPTREYHMIAVADGQVANLHITEMSSTFYIGHYTLTGARSEPS